MRLIMRFLNLIYIVAGITVGIFVPGDLIGKAISAAGVAFLLTCLFNPENYNVIKAYEKGGIFLWGKLVTRRGPGPAYIFPWETLLVKDTRQQQFSIPVQSATVFGGQNLPFDLDVDIFARTVDPVKLYLSMHEAGNKTEAQLLIQYTQGAATRALDAAGKKLFSNELMDGVAIVTWFNRQLLSELDTATEAIGIKIDNVQITRMTPPPVYTQQTEKLKIAEADASVLRIGSAAEVETVTAQRNAEGADYIKIQWMDTLRYLADQVQKSNLKALTIGGDGRGAFTVNMPLDEKEG